MSSATFSSMNPTIAGDVFLVRGTLCRKTRGRSAIEPRALPGTAGPKDEKATPDKLDLLGPAIGKVGDEAMAIVGGKPDGVSLYVELGKGWISASVYKAERKAVQYFSPRGSDLIQVLIDARCLEPAAGRWWAMRYTIDGGKFDAHFDYDPPTTLGENSDDRRERFLRLRYGKKPVIYPPPFHDTTPSPPMLVAIAIPPSPYTPPSASHRSSQPSSSTPSARPHRPWSQSSSPA